LNTLKMKDALSEIGDGSKVDEKLEYLNDSNQHLWKRVEAESSAGNVRLDRQDEAWTRMKRWVEQDRETMESHVEQMEASNRSLHALLRGQEEQAQEIEELKAKVGTSEYLLIRHSQAPLGGFAG
jgi:hypothetical protein